MITFNLVLMHPPCVYVERKSRNDALLTVKYEAKRKMCCPRFRSGVKAASVCIWSGCSQVNTATA